MDEFDEQLRPASGQNTVDVRPIPRISIQTFAETGEFATIMAKISEDRRMARAHVNNHRGGIRAATEFYENAPTPNVIVVESKLEGEELLDELHMLANVCDPDTKVIVVGQKNDVELYRKLIRFGVSEYMVMPVDALDIIQTIGEMFAAPDADPIGHSIVFVPAKGGSGSSTIAQNVAWALSIQFLNEVILADFDLAGGTVGLNFNQDPARGISEALFSPEKLDETYLDRLLTKCTEHLNLLASPVVLDKPLDFDRASVDRLIELAQKSVPYFVADLPYQWSDWVMGAVTTADDVVVTTTADLAGLRNAKNIFDSLKQMRSTDKEPYVVLNQIGRSKDTEIKPGAFEDALETELALSIPFEPALFGTAMNNGQMLSEVNAKSQIAQDIKAFAATLSGRSASVTVEKKSSLLPFLSKLGAKKKAS